MLSIVGGKDQAEVVYERLYGQEPLVALDVVDEQVETLLLREPVTRSELLLLQGIRRLLLEILGVELGLVRVHFVLHHLFAWV